MKLYHGTQENNLPNIKQVGLIPNGIGIVYLTPQIEVAKRFGDGKTVLEVETGNNKLTAFEDCSDWEVLCWGNIPPENIKEIR